MNAICSCTLTVQCDSCGQADCENDRRAEEAHARWLERSDAETERDLQESYDFGYEICDLIACLDDPHLERDCPKNVRS